MLATLPVCASSDIIIRSINVLKDGGTIELMTNLGIYYIDHRVRSNTDGRVYNDLPGKGRIVNDGLAARVKRAYLATHHI